MATQTSGNGQRRQQQDAWRRYRDSDFTRGAESNEERDWRGRGEDRDDRWRDERLSSWDRDRGSSFDRGSWDQRGDQMYGAGQSRREQFGDNEYLDEGR